jgi:hypothetical protein
MVGVCVVGARSLDTTGWGVLAAVPSAADEFESREDHDAEEPDGQQDGRGVVDE